VRKYFGLDTMDKINVGGGNKRSVFDLHPILSISVHSYRLYTCVSFKLISYFPFHSNVAIILVLFNT